MIDFSHINNQPACLQVGFFYIKIPALSVNEFYSIIPNQLPALELLFNVIIKKDILSFVKLKHSVDEKNNWIKSVLFLALKKQYKFHNQIIIFLVFILLKLYSDCFLFQLLAKQNGLISYFDLAYSNKNKSTENQSEKEIIENYCLNFSLIRQLFGDKINNQTIELTNIHDVLTYTQFHFFLNSDLLLKGLSQTNAQVSLDPDKHSEREISYIESQFTYFKNLMKGCFGNELAESRYFDEDIEKRFKAGMGRRNIELYNLFKGVFKL